MLIAATTVRTVLPVRGGVVAVAARMFSEDQLKQPRSFPDIGRDGRWTLEREAKPMPTTGAPLDISLAALMVARSCNLGPRPVVKAGTPICRGRLPSRP